MGLFDKFFEKKVCAICGEEIGMFGNRKLEDGNCCKNCAAKLSRWFDERRHSTVEEIKAQLAYREENQKRVNRFHVTRSLGNYPPVLIDDDMGAFIVPYDDDWKEENPDVVDFGQVTACDVDVEEHSDEVYRTVKDREGNSKRVSYSPRRYRYHYYFKMLVRVDHPYFDEMRFNLNSSPVRVDAVDLFDLFDADSGRGSTRPPTLSERRNDSAYSKYEEQGYAIRDALLSVTNRPRRPEPEAAPEAPTRAAPAPEPVVCPWCGSKAVPNPDGTCSCCGGSLKG